MGKKSRAEAWLGRTRLQGLTVDKKTISVRGQPCCVMPYPCPCSQIKSGIIIIDIHKE